MCVIVAKYKNKRLPTKDELTKCFNTNKDGAGFMYVKNNKVVIDKGYMDLDSFLNKYDKLCEENNNFKNKSLVIHCRIGTSSGNTPENTHPYPVSNKEKDMHKLKFETDFAMAHNGIISKYTPHWQNPTTNDTQEFVMKYVYNLYSNYNEFYKNKYIREGLADITNSRLAFLNSKDELYLVGNYVEHNGLMFSNDNWNFSYYNSWKDWRDYSYYDYDDYKDCKTKTTKKVEEIDINWNDVITLEEGFYITTEEGKFIQVTKDDELYYDYITGNVYGYDIDVDNYVLVYKNCFAYTDDFTELELYESEAK